MAHLRYDELENLLYCIHQYHKATTEKSVQKKCQLKKFIDGIVMILEHEFYTSNSFSSKIHNKLSGMISFNPFKKVSISSFTLLAKRYCAKLSRYCRFRLFVTFVLLPLGTKSTTLENNADKT